jgi:hypothetical protein
VCGEPSGTYVLRKTYCDTHGQKFTFGKWDAIETYATSHTVYACPYMHDWGLNIHNCSFSLLN